ncbi:hypothetical protein HMPREF9120_00404 [Neisseria sp. oral taxon 020 str. F0370]|nr:hypothetical protein HMPREF9120_00404 [Neisseria sp. oral taxon 020 str. F0370]
MVIICKRTLRPQSEKRFIPGSTTRDGPPVSVFRNGIPQNTAGTACRRQNKEGSS